MDPIVLTVPERLDDAGIRALDAGLEAANADAAQATVIVLEGRPESFCLGMDFSELRDPRRSADAVHSGLELFARALRLLMRSPHPTLAIVDGPALAGGLGLAAACDVVVATERASVGLPEALYGLAPAIIRPALLTRLSPQKLRLLLFSCHSRSAEEALALGLFDVVVPVPALPRARGDAVRSLRRARTESVIAARRWDEDELDRQLFAGVRETDAALSDPRTAAAVRAFTTDEDVPWLS
jgi:enoyl-CoA hydratase/carnithine racemase